MDKWHVKKSHNSPHHPESNGACEASHKEISKHLRLALQQYGRDWGECVSMIEYVHNSTPTSGMAYSPFYLAFGRWPLAVQDLPLMQQRCPSQKGDDYERWVEQLQSRLQKAQDTMVNVQWQTKEENALRMQKLRRISTHKVGDQVLVWRPAATHSKIDKTSRKLMWAAVGPMSVVKKLTRGTYVVRQDTGRTFRVNSRDMFPFARAESSGASSSEGPAGSSPGLRRILESS